MVQTIDATNGNMKTVLPQFAKDLTLTSITDLPLGSFIIIINPSNGAVEVVVEDQAAALYGGATEVYSVSSDGKVAPLPIPALDADPVGLVGYGISADGTLRYVCSPDLSPICQPVGTTVSGAAESSAITPRSRVRRAVEPEVRLHPEGSIGSFPPTTSKPELNGGSVNSRIPQE
jgi:hypothetical protein